MLYFLLSYLDFYTAAGFGRNQTLITPALATDDPRQAVGF
jgi:hypothetical protein